MTPHYKLNVLEVCVTKRRLTNVLTSGGPRVTKEQRLGFEIVYVCIIEVGDSVRCLLPRVLSSEATRQVKSFLAG